MRSWIDEYIAATDYSDSPQLYRKWTAIYAIASVLGRSVYMLNSKGVVYPNLFVLFIGNPSVGKSQAIKEILPFMDKAGVIRSPTDFTRAGIVDHAISQCKLEMLPVAGGGVIPGDQKTIINIVATELTETFRGFDVHLLGMFANWWDNPDIYKEEKRSLKKSRDDGPIELHNITCGIIAATQPGVLVHVFPPEAWNGGFLSRTIIVYQDKGISRLVFNTEGEDFNIGMDIGARTHLENKILSIKDLVGEFKPNRSFVDEYIKWAQVDNKEPYPKHPNLQFYCDRREYNLMKLSLIIAASCQRTSIDGADFLAARATLEEVEGNMEEVFTAAISNEDTQRMETIQIMLASKYPDGMSEMSFHRYIGTLIPVTRTQNFIWSLIQAGYVEKVSDTATLKISYMAGVLSK